MLQTVLLVRFGVLAAIAAHLVTSWSYLLNLNFSAWYATQTIVLWVLLIALGGYACFVSLGRKPALLQIQRPG